MSLRMSLWSALMARLTSCVLFSIHKKTYVHPHTVYALFFYTHFHSCCPPILV
jgi:hypothetical protein